MKTDLKEHILKSLSKNLRFDGRKWNEYRKITVEYGISKSAEGSARVKIGNTEVLAGVKMELNAPYSDKPEEGTIIVGAELLPLSNPLFESGPPTIQAVELARVVDRGIRESKTIDFKKLCVTPGEKAWILVIDIVTVNDEGNLFDASALAAMAALQDARFPKVNEKGIIDYHEKTKEKVHLSSKPVSVTILKIGGNFIVDPTTEEETVYDSRLSVATTDDGEICALQKGGDEALTEEEISKMLDIGIEKGKEIRKYL